MEKNIELAFIIVGDEGGSAVQKVCSIGKVHQVIQEMKGREAREYEAALVREAQELLEYVSTLSQGDFDFDRYGNINTLEKAKEDVAERWKGDSVNHWSGSFRYAQMVIARKGVRIYTNHRIAF